MVKAACLEVGDRVFEPHSGLRDLKKQNVSSLLTWNDSILWRASVTVPKRDVRQYFTGNYTIKKQ